MEEVIKIYGLAAIGKSNGWAVSGVGISIVFSGLISLSFVISQLHKLLNVWEDPSKLQKMFQAKKSVFPSLEDESVKAARAALTVSQKEVIKQYALLRLNLEDHFPLSRLLYLGIISGLKDPHENLNQLLKTKIIRPDKEGLFTWDKTTFDQIV
ncbi:MAG: OadG family protein [Pseudomonadota bacterium]